MKKKRMKLFKKDWTPDEADEWTIHDFWASLLGVLAYILIAAALSGNGETGWSAIKTNLPGVLFPAAVFALSFWMTWLLYRHFVKAKK